ncbi:MAG: TIM barrel protein [Kiritimatiellae bacterium]|nr:TIM barrel protein [Kiritimatiellia bacterium]
MDLLVFPKFFYPHLDEKRLADTMTQLGFDGVDVMIRDAAWCKEDDCRDTLPRFVRTMRGAGLACYSATTDWKLDRIESIEDDYRFFADHGIRMFRFGLTNYAGFGTWQRDFERARAGLAALEKIGQRHGVKALLQTHGGNLTWSAEAAAFMVQGLDPNAVGVHYDPGNFIHQEGYTHAEKAIDVLGEYLAYVGVKNAGWFRCPDHARNQRMRWAPHWTWLSEGQVNWPRELRVLKAAGFAGPLCMHNFYESGVEGLTRQTADDVVYLRGLMRDTGLA